MNMGELLDMLIGWREMEVLNVSSSVVKDDAIEIGEGYSVNERSDEITVTFVTPVHQVRMNTRIIEK